MSQPFVVTDARFTLFGNLIDGEKLAPGGESLDSVFTSIVGVAPANTQRTLPPQIPTITASAPLRGNVFAIQLQPGRVDISIAGGPTPKPSGPHLVGDFGEELMALVNVGRTIFGRMSDPNRIALAVGGAFTYEDTEAPLKTFSVMTGISTDNDLTEPLFRANRKSISDNHQIMLNAVKSFEVGQVQNFEIIGNNFKMKVLHVLRCAADYNCDPFDGVIPLDHFEDVVSNLIRNAYEFVITPGLHPADPK